jgi:iron complex transport system permease protein
MQNPLAWLAVRRTAGPKQPAWLQRRPLGLLVAPALAVVILIAIICAGVGSVPIPPGAVLRTVVARLAPAWGAGLPAEYSAILLQLRLPRVLLVAITGAALAGAGAAYQGLFRNPLADPYLIGVAAGAGLGAIGAQTLRTSDMALAAAAPPLGAFVGALATVALVYTIARAGRGAPGSLLLAGVAVSSLASALATLLLLRLSRGSAGAIAFLLGGYSNASWTALALVAPMALAGLAVLMLYARQLNLLLFDADQARQLGVNVERATAVVIVAATLSTAAAVAFGGLIGFVGMIVPHVARLLVGGDHRRLLPMAAIGGAGFLMLADLVARTAFAPEELPLGIITACVGAPFFLWLLRRN